MVTVSNTLGQLRTRHPHLRLSNCSLTSTHKAQSPACLFISVFACPGVSFQIDTHHTSNAASHLELLLLSYSVPRDTQEPIGILNHRTCSLFSGVFFQIEPEAFSVALITLLQQHEQPACSFPDFRFTSSELKIL